MPGNEIVVNDGGRRRPGTQLLDELIEVAAAGTQLTPEVVSARSRC